MNEKRFTLIDMNNIEWKLISPIKDNGRDITVKQVVDLLNTLHEENTILKTTNYEMEDYLARLEEENQQLKKMKNKTWQIQNQISLKNNLIKTIQHNTNNKKNNHKNKIIKLPS